MSKQREYIALMGNPNSGKTAIFNLLTGMNLKVSNYPGITVEMRRGTARISPKQTVEIMDLPGTYSLTPESMDERIVAQQTLRWMGGEDRPQAIISDWNQPQARCRSWLKPRKRKPSQNVRRAPPGFPEGPQRQPSPRLHCTYRLRLPLPAQ